MGEKKKLVKEPKRIIQNVNSKTVFDQGIYTYKLFDKTVGYNNYTEFASKKKVMQRFEVPVTVNSLDVSFRNANDIYDFDVIFYDENKNKLKTVHFTSNGVTTFSEISNVHYVELINNSNAKAYLSEFELLGDYTTTKKFAKSASFTFTSKLNERPFYQPSVTGNYLKEKFRTLNDLEGKEFNVTSVYDWNENKKHFNWLEVESEELGIKNEWIQISGLESEPMFYNDLIEKVYGQFVKRGTFDPEYALMDNNITATNYTNFNLNEHVDYEFDVPVTINGLYVQNEPSSINNQVEVTFFKENGHTENILLTDDQLFERF